MESEDMECFEDIQSKIIQNAMWGNGNNQRVNLNICYK